MTRAIFFSVVLVCALVLAQPLAAQDLVIANARIITGTGQVIEQGSIVVRSGKIDSVVAGPAPKGAKVLDAKGMTAIAGFIDGHRHIIGGDAQRYLKEQAADRMREFLEAGYTTLLSGGGAAEPVLELKKRIDSGQLKGPRIIPSAP
ncbi:MAG TPA: hypothetical protein VIR54_06370, partial [Vicinamibacterales bacterium]